jgi:hypothetical protein
MGSRILEASPTSIIPGGRGPILGNMRRPIIWGSGIILGQEGPRRLWWGGTNTPARNGSREWSRRYLALWNATVVFSVSLLFHPFLIVVFHILFVFSIIAISFLRTENCEWDLYHSSHNKAWTCWSMGNWPHCQGWILIFLKTLSHYLVQAGLELTVSLLQHLECWNGMKHHTQKGCWILSNAFLMSTEMIAIAFVLHWIFPSMSIKDIGL